MVGDIIARFRIGFEVKRSRARPGGSCRFRSRFFGFRSACGANTSIDGHKTPHTTHSTCNANKQSFTHSTRRSPHANLAQNVREPQTKREDPSYGQRVTPFQRASAVASSRARVRALLISPSAHVSRPYLRATILRWALLLFVFSFALLRRPACVRGVRCPFAVCVWFRFCRFFWQRAASSPSVLRPPRSTLLATRPCVRAALHGLRTATTPASATTMRVAANSLCRWALALLMCLVHLGTTHGGVDTLGLDWDFYSAVSVLS